MLYYYITKTTYSRYYVTHQCADGQNDVIYCENYAQVAELKRDLEARGYRYGRF